jgi:hypothetical protein
LRQGWASLPFPDETDGRTESRPPFHSRLARGCRNHVVLPLVPLFFDHPVLDDMQTVLLQKIVELIFIHHRSEIDRRKIDQSWLQKVQNRRVLTENGLKEHQPTAWLEPPQDTLQNRLLIFKKHETHTEKDKIEMLRGRIELFHRLMIDMNVVFHPVLADEIPALAQIMAIDIDADDLQSFVPDKRVKILDHRAITDADIENSGIPREIVQTIFITIVRGIVNKKAIQAIA